MKIPKKYISIIQRFYKTKCIKTRLQSNFGRYITLVTYLAKKSFKETHQAQQLNVSFLFSI